MRRHFFGLALPAAIAAVVLYTGGGRVAAQEAQPATPAPSAAATPMTPDGHPDLNGYWYRRWAPIAPQREGESVIVKPAWDGLREIEPGIPTYKPEFLAKVEELNENQIYEDRTYACGAPGVPRIGPPQRIVQTPREVVILYDDLSGNFFRVIPTDGRPHRTSRAANPSGLGNVPIELTPNGDSVGHWEGDTLVIDVRNFSADTWLGDNGWFHTEDMRVIERLRREGNTLTWQVTVEDPAVLAEPWQMNSRTLTLRPDDEIEQAAFCQERTLPLKTDLEYHSNIR